MQSVVGTYGDNEVDYIASNSDGSANGTIQAGSSGTQTTNTRTTLVGTQKLSNGTITYNDDSSNTDVQTTSSADNLGFWASGGYYGTVRGTVSDNSTGSYQLNAATSLNNGVLNLTQNGGGGSTMQMTDTEVISYANGYPTATDTLVSSESGSSDNSVSAGGTLSDDNGHTGQWTFAEDTGGNGGGQLRISWVQAGYGPWSMTGNWFSVNSSGYDNYAFSQHDNGLGDTLSPGETGTFSNTQDVLGNFSQSQSATGSFSNFAFTVHMSRLELQSSASTSTTADAAAGTGGNSDFSTDKVTTAVVSMAGQNSNGLQNLSSISVYQLSNSTSASDGSDYAPGGGSSGHMRFANKSTTQLSGSSAAGTGQQSSSLRSAEWGTQTSNGQTTSWGNPAGYTNSPPPVNLSWPSPAAPPPPSPPPASLGNMSSQGIFAIPPQPVSGPPLLESTEAMLKRNAQMEANGQTPPPLTWGSAQAYGSDGNRTGQQGLGQSAQLAVTMLSQYSGPLLGLGFNTAMTVGSVVNGDAQGVVSFGGQAIMNGIEIAALVNPCGLAAKGLAAYGATVTGSQLFEPGGFTLQNLLVTGYNLMAFFGACFTGDMLVDVEGGKKRADEVKVGDKLWSRDEFDPDGPLVLKEVEERFVRVTLVLNLRVAGQVLRTTGEHPFWVENRRRWLQAGELKVGDLLRTRSGSLVAVEGLEDSGQVETVYNWRIADYHTYDVSATEDGASIWAHNATYVQSGSYNEANNAAMNWIKSKGGVFVSQIRLTSKFTGKPYGWATADGKVGFRIEFDARSGAHINAWVSKQKSPHFQFPGSEADVLAVLRQLFPELPVLPK